MEAYGLTKTEAIRWTAHFSTLWEPTIVEYDNLPAELRNREDSLLQLQGASVSYRIALGAQQGQKVFTLQTLPASTGGEYGQLANTSPLSVMCIPMNLMSWEK